MTAGGADRRAKRTACGLAVLAHPLEEGFADAPKVLLSARRSLAAAGLAVTAAPRPITRIEEADEAARLFVEARVPLVVLLPATWSDDFLATRILRACSVPAATWGIPGIASGSLCGAQQIGCVFFELGVPFRFFHGAPDDAVIARGIAALARVAMLRERLRRARIGLVGARTHGMTEIAVDEVGLRRVLGPEVYQTPMHRFEAGLSDVDPRRASALWRQMKARAREVRVDDAAGLAGARVAVGLEQWMDENRLDAVAVDCYPDRMGVFCLAASVLAARGKVVACEADAHAALLQLALMDLTGGPTHNADLLHVDPAGNTILLSHCGNGALALADPAAGATLAPVRLAGDGCCVLFPARPGPVTLANLVGREGTYRLTVLEGEAVPAGMEFAGNPLRVRLPVSVDAFLKTVADHGAGHHWVAGYGRVETQVAELARLSGVRAVEMG